MKSPCDNPNVSGSLSCSTLTFNGPPVGNDFLGISSKSECQRLFGRNANTLFSQITYAGQNCSQMTDNRNEGLVLGGLTNTTTNLCHSDGGSSVRLLHTREVSNESNSDIPNLGQTACDCQPEYPEYRYCGWQ